MPRYACLARACGFPEAGTLEGGPDRRAVPAVPVRAATMEELAAAGYRPGPWQAQ